jgi:hypothetical protein
LVTTTEPVAAPTGTVHVIMVSNQLETSACVPLNVTVDDPWVNPKYLPFIVTVVPKVPLEGESPLIKGCFTVNFFKLEPPTWLVTTTEPVVALTGTVHVMLISDHEVTTAGVPLNVTVDEPFVAPKYLPFIITVAPNVPLEGESPLIAGVFIVNFFKLEPPTWLVTTTDPVVAFTGTVHVMLISDQLETSACVPLNVTVDKPFVAPKYLPFIITVAPIVPLEGESPLIAGGFAVNGFPLELPPESVVTTTRPVVGPSGTLHMILVSDQLVMGAVTPLKVTADED